MTGTNVPNRHAPDRHRALNSYQTLAAGYDASCRHIERIRQDAVDSLRLSPGETVFDIACGTGSTILPMAESVGPSGHVVGVELVPEMAAIARGKLVAVGFDDRAAVHVSAAEDFTTDLCADAMLFCYTHDVLQSPQAIENLLRHAQPGCRIAVVGWHWLPWPWGFPVNLFNAWRARNYLTTYCGLTRPWHLLGPHLDGFNIEAHDHLGSSYRAYGTVSGFDNQALTRTPAPPG